MEKHRNTFLSYSRANKDFALRLAKELKSEGFPVWLDQLDIPLGARWDVEVEKALIECEIFMIIITKDSIASDNVLDEIGYAIDSGKRFLPLLLEECVIPLRLRRFQYVDFTNKGFDEGVKAAKELLRSLNSQPTIPRKDVPDTMVDVTEQDDSFIVQKTGTAGKTPSITPTTSRQETTGQLPVRSLSNLIWAIGFLILALVVAGFAATRLLAGTSSSEILPTPQQIQTISITNESNILIPAVSESTATPGQELEPTQMPTVETLQLPSSTLESTSTPQSEYVKVNWRGYCKYLGYVDAANPSQTIQGWKCVDEKGKNFGIDSYTEVCKWQVGSGNPVYLDPKDYDSWVCKTQ